MNKKCRMLWLSLMMLFAGAAYAQMSDEAVVAYVREGLASGKSKNELTKELVARGVTREQAERLKSKYEDLRTGNNASIRNVGDQERSRRLNDDETIVPQVLEDNVSVQATPVFGRNIFTGRNLTFAPNTNIATPANYKLGPGDEVIIDIWGTNQNTIRQTISPEGSINIEGLGLVNLNGMTIKEADNYMRRKLGQIYSVDGADAKSEIKLSLGNIRTIQVNLMGEVANPGTYYLSSLSNLYHALYRAGGVGELGSLRNIQLVRNGKNIAQVDVYDLILHGQMEGDVSLEDGDIIIVPTYQSLVSINGKVKRPMLYELKEGETLQDLLLYAGNFTGDAYRSNIQMIRQNGKEYQVYTIDQKDYATFSLVDGDDLTVGAMLDRFENKLEIKGAVYRPGVYQLGEDIQTVSQLLAKADGLKGDAFTNRALLHREREDLTLELIQVDVKAVLDGSAQDIKLQKNDVLYIPSIHDLQDLGHFTVMGEVAKPGSFVYADNTMLEDAIMLAGGLLESASTVKIDVSRRVKNAESTVETDTIGQVFTFAFKDGYILDGQDGFVLQPYDQVMVRRSPGYMQQTSVSITGEVLFPGSYVMTNKEERLSDLVQKAGGLNSWAYVKGARLQRKMNEDERNRASANIGSTKDSIDMNLLGVGQTYSVGIDLEKALNKPGSDDDLVLREGDVLIVPEYNNMVKISGTVMYPNVVTYSAKMTVKQYIDQAGGYAYRARKNKVYIVYMNGRVAKGKSASSSVVEPGCEIIVPQKPAPNGNTLSSILSVSTTAASLGTMIATIGNLIK